MATGRDALQRLVDRLSDPEALEREGMEACDALGVPVHYAEWKPHDWAHWRENLQRAQDALALHDDAICN